LSRAFERRGFAVQLVTNPAGRPIVVAELAPRSGLLTGRPSSAPIRSRAARLHLTRWRAAIPSHNVVAEVEALVGPTSAGKVTKVHNLPGAETGPGGVATWGRAVVDRADAFGFKWNRSGKSSKLIAFEWSGPD
jgi:hypothetical protein